MPSTTATLNEGFDVRIEYTTDEAYIEDITVLDPDTGKNLNKLLDDNSVAWKQAWSAAERHMLAQPITRHARRVIAASMASMCADTPYAYGAAA